ncbi:hypothetical protein VTK56DRAFT_5759 [Thermocarpiscus australiensis]
MYKRLLSRPFNLGHYRDKKRGARTSWGCGRKARALLSTRTYCLGLGLELIYKQASDEPAWILARFVLPQ